MRSLFTKISLLLVLCLTLGAQPHTTASPTSQAVSSTYLPLMMKAFYSGGEWSQDAHDAQRTGYSAIEPLTPWTLIWMWNGPDSTGGVSCPNNDPTKGHCYDAPHEARTVAGGGLIYVPAGARGLYGLSETDGHVMWNVNVATFNAAPAYADGFVYAGGANGSLYKINASNGSYQTYNAGNAINRAVLLVGSFAYVLTDDGHLHKVDASAMTQVWVYAANSNADMGLAYSASRDVIIFGTADLQVHAVNNPNGTFKWKTKPSPNPAGFPNQFLYYWPVVADQAGVVFVRMRLDHNAGLWGCNVNPCGPGGRWPNSNVETRSFLVSRPDLQNLFALNLDDGTKKFIPAVGYSGTEDKVPVQPFLVTGPLPVIKIVTGGREVAYESFRNGQSGTTDGRWDSHMGEMVLDNSTVTGLVAGDLRFVRMSKYNNYGGDSYSYITDEQNPITMAGNTLFHAHWGASESVRITDRSDSRGLSYNNPVVTVNNPVVIRRIAACGNKNTMTHYTTCNLQAYGDSRAWPSPGYWTYWNTWDPPTTSASTNAYSEGLLPRYTYVTGNLIVVEGNGGELMVFRHSGQ